MKLKFFYFAAILCAFSLTSCYTTHDVAQNSYTFSLLNDDKTVRDTGDVLSYEDSLLRASFIVGKKDIAFTMRNQTSNTAKIIWDESLFIRNGNPSKVMHAGVKYTDRNQSMPPSVVPAGTLFDDVIVPSDNVYWREGYYSQYGSSPGGWEKKELFPNYTSKGDEFRVFMPVQIAGTTKEYNFNFRVEDNKTTYIKERRMDVAKTTWLTVGLTMVPLLILLSAY